MITAWLHRSGKAKKEAAFLGAASGLKFQCFAFRDKHFPYWPHLNPLQPRAAIALAVAQGEDFSCALFF